ncbi:hypothetical protein B0I35DRAFT_407495 [Stachybotrys elegans]|uniref:Zn(2)-C6 fungal-type domain-containing protein n=1 Tax=Stachybotrys elegans TaxID=80388 RepID=A0A8K0SV32_9HYPO|nr:hypothetical protein B0I35DRAFT_407495 [Stachybotrys elegans]
MPGDSPSSVAGNERRSSSSSQRLPVNPRRHKVAPEQRKRVATACNSCNVRRIKCSGDKPCTQCTSTSRECVYPTAVEKVTIARADLDALRRKADAYDRALAEDPVRLQQLAGTSPSPNASPTASSSAFQVTDPGTIASLDFTAALDDESSSSASPVTRPEARLLRDDHGTARFLGATSSAAFVDQLNEFMGFIFSSPSFRQQQSPIPTIGAYHTRDSRPMRVQNINPVWLPPPSSMSTMLTELRNIVHDGNGDWPSGGIYWWADFSVLPPVPTPESSASDLRHLALLNAALAVLYYRSTGSRQHQQRRPSEAATPSETFFARAVCLLGNNPLDMARTSTIDDVATLSLLGLYLIQADRCDSAAFYVAMAIRTAIMMGAHRGYVDERGKRIFWTAYVLDRWVACALGRPATIADDDIHLPPPEDHPSMPPAGGLAAHVDLARISSLLLSSSPGHINRTTWMLSQWEAGLPPSLRDPSVDDPTVSLLHLQHQHLLFLTLRPSFLASVKRSFADRFTPEHADSSYDPQVLQRHAHTCIAAAQRIMVLVRHASALDARRRGPSPTSSPSVLLHFGLQSMVDAVLCLLLHQLSPSALDVGDDVEFALRQLQDEGTEYARDWAAVIVRVRTFVAGLRARMAELDGSGQHDVNAPFGGDILAMMGDEWALQMHCYGLDEMEFS